MEVMHTIIHLLHLVTLYYLVEINIVVKGDKGPGSCGPKPCQRVSTNWYED